MSSNGMKDGNMRRRFLLPILLLPALVLAADPPQSQSCRRAKEKFEAGVGKLEEDYQKTMIALRQSYVRDLNGARAGALAKKDLEEAQRILAVQQALEEEARLAAGPLEIITASYSFYKSWHDVTDATRKLVKNGELRLSRSEQPHMGQPDPAFGQHKALVVVYRYKGFVRLATIGEDQAVKLP